MRNIILLLTAVFFASLFACGDKEDPTKTDSLDPAFIYYPTEIGNYWNYERLFWFEGMDTNSFFPDSVYSLAHVEIEGDTMLNDTLNTFEFVEYHTDNNTNVVKTYFTNETTGFYMQAYRGAGIATPVKSDYKLIFNNHKFNSLGELFDFISGFQKIPSNINVKSDTTYPSFFQWEDPPIESLSYPLYVGKEWVYRAESVLGGMNRKVVSAETVETPAGSFDCYKVKLVYLDTAYANKIQYFDYISSKGLIQRMITFRITFTDIEGNIIGTGDAIEELKLSSYFIQ